MNAMSEPKTKKIEGKYKLSILSSDGKNLKSSTDSLLDSLLSYKPEIIKGKTVIKVQSGDKVYEKVIFVPIARKLFFNDFAMKTFARNVERALQ